MNYYDLYGGGILPNHLIYNDLISITQTISAILLADAERPFAAGSSGRRLAALLDCRIYFQRSSEILLATAPCWLWYFASFLLL